MAGDLAGVIESGEDVDEAEELDFELLLAHRPIHEAAGQVAAAEEAGGPAFHSGEDFAPL